MWCRGGDCSVVPSDRTAREMQRVHTGGPACDEDMIPYGVVSSCGDRGLSVCVASRLMEWTPATHTDSFSVLGATIRLPVSTLSVVQMDHEWAYVSLSGVAVSLPALGHETHRLVPDRDLEFVALSLPYAPGGLHLVCPHGVCATSRFVREVGGDAVVIAPEWSHWGDTVHVPHAPSGLSFAFRPGVLIRVPVEVARTPFTFRIRIATCACDGSASHITTSDFSVASIGTAQLEHGSACGRVTCPLAVAVLVVLSTMVCGLTAVISYFVTLKHNAVI